MKNKKIINKKINKKKIIIIIIKSKIKIKKFKSVKWITIIILITILKRKLNLYISQKMLFYPKKVSEIIIIILINYKIKNSKKKKM